MGADPAFVATPSSQEAVSTKGFNPGDIPWHLGCSDESYGVRVWVSRIENLRTHFRIISDHLPDDDDERNMGRWLRGQVRVAIEEADKYIADCCPEAGLALATQSTGETA